MIARLQYSQGGFERALQMTSAAVVTIVEGVNDILYYEKLLSEYLKLKKRTFTFQVRTPREVRGQANGKPALLDVFLRLRKKKKLAWRDATDTNHSIIFIADKDYDEISKRKLRNDQLIYTPGVCIENAKFDSGDLLAAIECCVGRTLPTDFEFSKAEFKISCLEQWRDWVIYCVACEISGVAPRKNRAGMSLMHHGKTHVVDSAKVLSIFAEFKLALGSEEEGEIYISRAKRIVQNAIRTAEVDKVFCGWWYPHFLAIMVERISPAYTSGAARVRNTQGFYSHLLHKIDYSCKSAQFLFDGIDSATVGV